MLRADERVERISAICRSAAQIAADRVGIPVEILHAISLTETGRRMAGQTRPWPWTVNMEGKGVWFDDPGKALEYARTHHARGARSFDVGCFQINYRWHGNAFQSIEHMFDPVSNAVYAARFLKSLHAEFGDWTRAAGAYHSRTPKFARKYEARFERFLARATGTPANEPPRDTQVALATAGEPPRRESTYPLFRAGVGPRSGGSLVPLGAAPAFGRFIAEDRAR
ncbi:transglycosylase SLT domain-containing protein [Alphaproteobacteria bacterium GH1-50]|uniref:Transglycosylase SLT domain-containing protein n=1 Tax=Kangsaoukella pontilimi TaxID=2691042 RepID=A0A7C9IGR6_9RHOB|nr:transglycosylase SLT domain-containing protein [Kangsaoukella pontilimi]MXQ08167.1 transglycosylase SLT domain-containing protein [Kangsaoukella pontilimi]